MPLVNILLILTILSMTKIIYSHNFMMEKSLQALCESVKRRVEVQE